jgi:hypothetical protein
MDAFERLGNEKLVLDCFLNFLKAIPPRSHPPVIAEEQDVANSCVDLNYGN